MLLRIHETTPKYNGFKYWIQPDVCNVLVGYTVIEFTADKSVS